MYVIQILDPVLQSDDDGSIAFVGIDTENMGSPIGMWWTCINPHDATRLSLEKALSQQKAHPDVPTKILNEEELDVYLKLYDVMGT